MSDKANDIAITTKSEEERENDIPEFELFERIIKSLDERKIKNDKLIRDINERERNSSKRVDNFFDEKGILFEKIEYSGISLYKNIYNSVFMKEFENFFFGQLDFVLENLYFSEDKKKINHNTHMALKKRFPDLQFEFSENIFDVFCDEAKTLRKNKSNRNNFYKYYMKFMDTNLIKFCMNEIMESVKTSLDVESNLHDKDIKNLFLYRKINFSEYNLLKEFMDISGEDKDDIELVIKDVLKYLANILDSDSKVPNDLLHIISSIVYFDEGRGCTVLGTKKSEENKKTKCLDFIEGYYLILSNELKDLLEDNVMHLLGNYTKFVFEFYKHLDGESADLFLGNFSSLDEMKKMCEAVMIYSFISPYSIVLAYIEWMGIV